MTASVIASNYGFTVRCPSYSGNEMLLHPQGDQIESAFSYYGRHHSGSIQARASRADSMTISQAKLPSNTPSTQVDTRP
jgi:hypothetical protein